MTTLKRFAFLAPFALAALIPLSASASIATYVSPQSGDQRDCTSMPDFTNYAGPHCAASSHPFAQNVINDVSAHGGIQTGVYATCNDWEDAGYADQNDQEVYYCAQYSNSQSPSPGWLSCGTGCGENFPDVLWGGVGAWDRPDWSLTANRACYLTDPRDSTEHAIAYGRDGANGGGTAGGGERTTLVWNGSIWNIYRTSRDYAPDGADWNRVLGTLSCASDAVPHNTLTANTTSINLGDSVNLSWDDTYWSAYPAETALNGSCTSNFDATHTTYYEHYDCVGDYTYVYQNDDWEWNGCAYETDAGYQDAYVYTPASGTTSVSPTQTTTYTYACTNTNGSNTASVTVNVNQPTPAPTASLSANPTTINVGSSSGLSWSCSNSTSAYISGVGGVATSGSTSVSPSSTTTYGLTCYGAGGQSTSYATVTVNAACTSTANACGQTNNGNVVNGSCNAPTPANPSYYGTSCTLTSAQNSCGQTNSTTGTYNCAAQCSGTTPAAPSEQQCHYAPSAPQLWGLYDNSTATYYGSSAPGYYNNGYAMYANSVDPYGENVDYLFYFYDTQTGQYTTNAWSGWTGSGGWNYVTGLQNLPDGTYLVGAYAMNSDGTYSGFSGWATVTLTQTACTSTPNACGQTASGHLVNGSCNASTPSNSGCPPSCTLVSSPSTIVAGSPASLTWSCSNATSCTAAGGFDTGGAPNNSSGVSVLPTNTSNYQISCTGPGGTAPSNIVTVTVLHPAAYITATPLRVASGAATTLSWSATDVSSCSITGTDGFAWSSGAVTSVATTTASRTISTQSKYTITCSTQTAPVSSSVIVNVLPSFQEF